MKWSQPYFLFGHGLMVSALLAATPIFTLLFLLGVMRRSALVAGTFGLGAALLLAIDGYRMPVITAFSAAANGAAFGLFPISWIVFWAIALFRLTVQTGKFEIVKDSVGRLSSDRRMQALLIAFAFGAFLEGAAGFGAPVAVAAAMLTGLGFSAFSASAICLLANTAPVAFGSIGIPVITLAGTTGLSVPRLSAAVGLVCAPVALIIPSYLIASMWSFAALAEVWVPALGGGAAFAAVQYLVARYMGPQLADILASLSAIAVLIGLLRLRRNQLGDSAGSFDCPSTTAAAGASGNSIPNTAWEAIYAWSPYILLVLCVLLWGLNPVQAIFNRVSLTFPWPALNGVVQLMPPIASAPSPYPAIFKLNWLSAAGTACMTATMLSALLLRVSPRDFAVLVGRVMRQLLVPTATVACVLAIAALMNFCGATGTLGLAFAGSHAVFPFFSALLGWLGVFLTGSDTSSNALFGNLQVITANRLGLDPVLMAAVNSVGGVMGKMISLQTIAIAAAATGMSASEQSRLFRFTLKHSLILAGIVGSLALILAYIRT